MAKNKRTFLQGIWVPDHLIPHHREDEVRITLRKLVFYLIFLVLFSAVILAMIPPLLYIFSTALRKQFLNTGFECQQGITITFEKIQTANDVWMYLQHVLVDSLYTDYWYSNHLKIKPTEPDDNKVLYENAFLGLPRIRQLRVRNDSCTIHDNFKKTFGSCYSYYSYANADKNSFHPPNTTTKDTAWTYHAANMFSGVPYFGIVSTYPQGGFYHDLSFKRNETVMILEDLMKNLWITRNTRVVFVDFALYNANINMFSVIKIIFEFPPTGGVIPTATFTSHKFLRYLSKGDYVILGCEIICILFIISYSVDEIRLWAHYKKKRFQFFWTYVNAVFFFFAYVVIGSSVFRIYFINEQIHTIKDNPDIYINFDSVMAIRNLSNNFMAIDLFICWIKVFKFLNLSRTMGQLSTLLKMCWRDIFGFSLMFFIIFFAFAQMGYLLFGAQIESFSTFGKSVMTLLITILGEFDYYEIERTNKVLAPIFFTTYIFFVFFVLFNMFLAIITDTYSEVKSDIKQKKTELEISEFLFRGPKTIFRKMRRKDSGPSEKRLSGKVFIDRIRHILELCNFTDLEIKVFLSMNNIDETEDITDEDVERVITQIRRAKHEEIEGDEGGEPNITPDMFMSQQQRLQTLNDDIQTLRLKVESIKIKRQ